MSPAARSPTRAPELAAEHERDGGGAGTGDDRATAATCDVLLVAGEGAASAAEELYDHLAASARPFLATRVAPGEEPQAAAEAAQREALLTVVVLVAPYQLAPLARAAVLTGLELAASPRRHRLVPLLLDGRPPTLGRLPYGLSIKQGIDVRAAGGLGAVAATLVAELRALRGEAAAEELVPVDEPFRLLRAFSRDDRALFFGRERARRDLAALVEDERLVVLHGASGTGKSSLLGAGLRPLVEERFTWVETTPGDDLVARIAAAARASLAARDRPAEARTAGELLLELARAAGGPVLLVVDQAEELFQRRRGAAELEAAAEALAAELLPCLQAAPSRGDVHVLLSVRDDYFGHLSYLRAAGLPVFAAELLLRPLDRTGTLLAIEEPLRLAGCRVAPRLLQRLVADLSPRDAEVRPVELTVVCHELFEAARRDGRRVLDVDLYDAMGGAGRVIATYLGRAMERIPPVRREAATRTLRALLGPDATRPPPVPLARVREAAGLDEAAAREALDELAQLRLVEATAADDGGARYRLAHDLVARELFERLGADEKAELAFRERVRQAATAWGARGRPRLRNRDVAAAERQELLAGARRWPAAEGDAAAFVAALRRLERRNRAALWATVVASLVVFAVGGVAIELARTSYREAQAERAEALAASYVATDPGKALAWVRESVRLRGAVTAGAWGTARAAAAAGVRAHVGAVGERAVLAFVPGSRQARAAAAAPVARTWEDRRWLAMGGTRGGAILDLASGRTMPLFDGTDLVKVKQLAFLPDGSALVVLGADGDLRVWTLDGGAPGSAPRRVRHPPESEYGAIAISPSGARIAAATLRGRLHQIDAASLALVSDDETLPLIEELAWSPADDGVIAGGTNGTVMLHTAGGRQHRTFGFVVEFGFSPDGERFVTSTGEVSRPFVGPVRPRGEGVLLASAHLVVAPVPGLPGVTAAFSGGHIAAADSDGTVHLLGADEGRGRFARTLDRHVPGVSTLALSPDGRWLASADAAGAVWVTATLAGAPLAVPSVELRADPDGVVARALARTFPDRSAVERGFFAGGAHDEAEMACLLDGADGGEVRRVAWHGEDGVVHLTPLALAGAPDRLLGDPQAPAHARGLACLAGGALVTTDEHAARRWDPAGRTATVFTERPGSWISALTPSPDRRWLLAAWGDGRVERFVDLRRAGELAHDPATPLALDDAGDVFRATRAGDVERLPTRALDAPEPVARRAGGVVDLAVSGDGLTLALSGVDGGVEIVGAGELRRPTGRIAYLELARDGRALLAGGDLYPLPPRDRAAFDRWLDERATYRVAFGRLDEPKEGVAFTALDEALIY